MNLLLITKADIEDFKENPRDFALHDQDIASKRVPEKKFTLLNSFYKGIWKS